METGRNKTHLAKYFREEIVINIDDEKGTTFGALRQGIHHFFQ